MAGTAGAVTWHVSGSGTFHATAGPGTLSSTGSNLICQTSTASGTYATGSIVNPIYSVTGTVNFANCLLAGQNTSVTCGYNLTGTAQPAATVVTGNADVTCGVTLTASGTKICHVAGAIHAIYTKNVSPAADTLTLTTTSTLQSSGAGCVLGTNDVNGHLSETTFVLTSPGGPHITRTN